ncbi:MAG: hypothetical protein GTN89_02345 [Acidobacteria bacterium]|nr:hypothetical protein [Acidobacteriota bacterium]NIO58210.1 hypothetical protein [Acidobacteriota bacterium]NIQ29227.1 hypothetical protein [Acidobacteriota bacterium]NIQ83804.1 hypothetical protein [Acidobacteriota bacterium]NIT09935.1 hypothetical protein [Acidobacteriota bacterium]
MKRRTSIATPLLAAVLAFACAGPGDDALDVDQLEVQEDQSESLANDLLAFSLAMRKADRPRFDDFWADTVSATPLPDEDPERKKVADRAHKGAWSFGEMAEFSRDDYIDELWSLVERYESLEDVRFKVKKVDFTEDGLHAKAKIKFFFVGKHDGHGREWIKGLASLGAGKTGEGKPEEDPWKIDHFELTEMNSVVTEQEWFSDVSGPAGLNEKFPEFGRGANDGFVNHGAAAADVNADGLMDVAASGVLGNFLYLNAGDGTFTDASADSLLKFTPPGSGVAFLDYDNDGDPDLFFAAVGRQILLENRFIPDGRVRFTDVSEESGAAQSAIGFSAVVADVNNDGWQDVYVCSYNRYGTIMPDSWTEATNGTPNLLLVNQGDGTFRSVADDWGVADSRWSYAAQFIDLDDDGDQDLYVANDFGENAFYRNDGGSFTEHSAEMGIVDPGFGMGVSFGDYDNDGDFDLHVTNMSSTAGKRILELLYPADHPMRLSLDKQAVGNSLYANRGDGTFEDVSAAIGGLGGGWAFGGGFVDFNGDGWEDLHTPNGFVSGETMKDT